MNGLPYLNRTDRQTGRKIRILIDTGATGNYCTKLKNGNRLSLKNPVKIKTIHKSETIDSYYRINLLSEQHIFYEVNNLGSFDMILGMKGLRKINAKIDTKFFKLTYAKKSRETVEHINYFVNEEIEDDFKNVIFRLMNKNNANEKIPYNTKVFATIRTTDNEPVWCKQYPYPVSAQGFVESEIEKLLNDGIIRPSQSPYNSPIWVVPKKGFNSDGTKKQRLVIDYKKLNNKTIFDRYPIPGTERILSNLGNSRYFSTVDLESGFHQIRIKESDKEKTAFSVNGAKYEFERMPFGLKNAPSIFQRAIDDILRPFIGKFAHVYMDDVLVFSKTKDEHAEHLRIIMKTLNAANMKVSDEKCKFFMQNVEFLGHYISNGKIRVDPKKVETIENYALPQTLKQLRSFLGLSGYYRKFIKNYANIVKPMTAYLRQENGRVSAKKSANVKVNFDEKAMQAFKIIKQKLRENIELFQPDYSKPFELTTDASNFAIGAVLSQNNKPITFVSRTLNETEQKYATNEKEALAIVWSLQHLRNYIYGIADLTIYTDHQPLTFAISEKNPNLKIKRWKNMIEESGAKLVYKPGKQNVVADALSRQYCCAIEDENSSEDTIHSQESSTEKVIPGTSEPLNAFHIQIQMESSNSDETTHNTIFDNYIRFHIKYSDIDSALRQLKHVIHEKNKNALFIKPEEQFRLVPKIKAAFPNAKFIITANIVRDITDPNEQTFLITNEHNRAHRAAKENYLQLKEVYFWPELRKNIISHVRKCEICKKNKYERHPVSQEIGETPIPNGVGEMMHIDIFFVDKQKYLTCFDKFSKFLQMFHINSNTEIPTLIEQFLSMNPFCINITTDNESIFISQMVKSIFDFYKITHHTTPIGHSETNGQVERVHSTILELSRSLAEQQSETISEVIFQAVREYNNSIHSVTKQKPSNVFYFSDRFSNIRELLCKAQNESRELKNKNRANKEFLPGDIIYVKSNRRNKTTPRYTKQTVRENKRNTIINSRGKEIHKDDIRK